METFLGTMIPFLGTALGAACVFFMKRSLYAFFLLKGSFPAHRIKHLQIRNLQNILCHHESFSVFLITLGIAAISFFVYSSFG